MLSFNGHAAFNARVSSDDVIYTDLKSWGLGLGGSEIRRALYYRGYLVWRNPSSQKWSLSIAEKAVGHCYRQVGIGLHHGYQGGFRTRRETLVAIDRLHERGLAPQGLAPQADPDAVENVTLTVSLNQARTILAALSRRHDELCLAVSAPGCDELRASAASWLAEVKSAYQLIDQQALGPPSK